MVHAAAPVIGFLALTLACFVFARRAFGLGHRAWAVFSVAIGIGIQALGVISNVTLNFLPLWAAMVLGFGWASAQAARLLAERRAADEDRALDRWWSGDCHRSGITAEVAGSGRLIRIWSTPGAGPSELEKRIVLTPFFRLIDTFMLD